MTSKKSPHYESTGDKDIAQLEDPHHAYLTSSSRPTHQLARRLVLGYQTCGSQELMCVRAVIGHTLTSYRWLAKLGIQIVAILRNATTGPAANSWIAKCLSMTAEMLSLSRGASRETALMPVYLHKSYPGREETCSRSLAMLEPLRRSPPSRPPLPMHYLRSDISQIRIIVDLNKA